MLWSASVICLNSFTRKSTKGLSLLSFIIINIANFFFLLSVVIILYDLNPNTYIDYIKATIQWIVGSSLTTLFDCVIFYQFYIYLIQSMVCSIKGSGQVQIQLFTCGEGDGF